MKAIRDSFENAAWYKAIMAIAALAVAVLGAVEGWVRFVEPAFREKPVADNVEIVFDISESMNRKFRDEPDLTKLQAARQAVENVLGNGAFDEGTENPSSLAFREFGGDDCGDTRLALKFSQKNRKPLQNLLPSLMAHGKSNLAHAINSAIADFGDPTRFEGVRKRIIVITGSDGSDCPASLIENITKQATQSGEKQQPDGTVSLDFHFIGILLGADERERVTSLSRAVGGQPPSFVDRRAELDTELLRIVVTEKAVGHARAVREILNGVSANLTTMAEDIKSRNYDAARISLAEARRQFDASNRSLESLRNGGRQEAQVQKLIELVSDSQELQSRLLALAAAMLSELTAGNIEAYDDVAKKYGEVGKAYNQKREEINQLITQIEPDQN